MKATVPTEEKIRLCHEAIVTDPVLWAMTAQLMRIDDYSRMQVVIANDGRLTINRVYDASVLPMKLQIEKWREERVEKIKSYHLEGNEPSYFM